MIWHERKKAAIGTALILTSVIAFTKASAQELPEPAIISNYDRLAKLGVAGEDAFCLVKAIEKNKNLVGAQPEILIQNKKGQNVTSFFDAAFLQIGKNPAHEIELSKWGGIVKFPKPLPSENERAEVIVKIAHNFDSCRENLFPLVFNPASLEWK